jgi:hypothetical protein
MLGPNITGSFGSVMQQAEYIRSGAFYTVADKGASLGTDATTGRYEVGFDASRSNSIYGNSATVQPKSLNLSILIKY